jgi:hypothetical protein
MDREEPVAQVALSSTRTSHLLAGTDQRSRLLLLAAAAVSFAFSVSLWFTGNELQGIFVGLWVPSILSLGAIVLPRTARQ